MEQSERLLPRVRRPILAVLLAPLLALALATVATRIAGPPPTIVTVPPAAVVWGDRVFTSSRPFAVWLKTARLELPGMAHAPPPSSAAPGTQPRVEQAGALVRQRLPPLTTRLNARVRVVRKWPKRTAERASGSPRRSDRSWRSATGFVVEMESG